MAFRLAKLSIELEFQRGDDSAVLELARANQALLSAEDRDRVEAAVANRRA